MRVEDRNVERDYLRLANHHRKNPPFVSHLPPIMPGTSIFLEMVAPSSGSFFHSFSGIFERFLRRSRSCHGMNKPDHILGGYSSRPDLPLPQVPESVAEYYTQD